VSTVISTVPSVNIASSPVKVAGIITDKHFTIDPYVSALCQKSLFIFTPGGACIRSFLTEDMAASVASAVVLSRLDYSNSLLFGHSVSNTAKLQRIQNTAVQIVLNTTTVPFPAVAPALALATCLFPYQAQNSYFTCHGRVQTCRPMGACIACLVISVGGVCGRCWS